MSYYIRKTVDELHFQQKTARGWETILIEPRLMGNLLETYKKEQPELPVRWHKKRVRQKEKIPLCFPRKMFYS